MIAEQLVGTLAPLALNAAMMIFYLVVMLRYSVLLTLIGLVSILANLVLSSVISKKRINLTRVQMRDAGKLAGTTVAGIEMIETIKASGAENGFFEKWAGYQASVNTSQVRFQRMNQLLGLLPALVSSICSTAVLMTGVFLAMPGQLYRRHDHGVSGLFILLPLPRNDAHFGGTDAAGNAHRYGADRGRDALSRRQHLCGRRRR